MFVRIRLIKIIHRINQFVERHAFEPVQKSPNGALLVTWLSFALQLHNIFDSQEVPGTNQVGCFFDMRRLSPQTASANLLEPDSEDLDAEMCRVRYAVIGGRYSIGSFRRMIYVEHRLDDGRLVDGRRPENELTVGIRWDFGN